MSEEEKKEVEENIKLVKFMMNKVQSERYNAEIEIEMYEDGVEGLISAVKTYDESKNVKRSTYYANCIWNRISRGFYIRSMQKRLINRNAVSYNQPVCKDSEDEIIDFIPSKVDVEKEVEDKINYERIIDKLNTYKPNKVKAFKMYYGIGCLPKPMTEIAKEFGVSATRIKNYVDYIRSKLRRDLLVDWENENEIRNKNGRISQ